MKKVVPTNQPSAATATDVRGVLGQTGPADAQDAAAVVPASPDGVRVAVVSRQALLRHVLQPVLQTHDRIDVVAEIDNIESDMGILNDARPDVVVLQVHDQHDIATVRTLAESLGDARVIVLSGVGTNDTVATAFEAGADGYLSLSLPLHVVVDAIANIGRPDAVDVRETHPVPPPREPAANHPDRAQFLTARETDVLRRFSNGESTRDIAAALGVSLSTIRTHTQNILIKLGVHSKVEAAAYAARNKLA